jgi:hypothetical protein
MGYNDKNQKEETSGIVIALLYAGDETDMASALAIPASQRSEYKPFVHFFKRLINALAASRIDAVRREMRFHEPRLRAAAEARGETFSIRFDKAELLPFKL